jgi:hypothetical protein
LPATPPFLSTRLRRPTFIFVKLAVSKSAATCRQSASSVRNPAARIDGKEDTAFLGIRRYHEVPAISQNPF